MVAPLTGVLLSMSAIVARVKEAAAATIRFQLTQVLPFVTEAWVTCSEGRQFNQKRAEFQKCSADGMVSLRSLLGF